MLLTALCFVSCTGKKDFKDGIVQLQSRPVSLSLDKMRCMWNGKDTVVSEERYDTDFQVGGLLRYGSMFFLWVKNNVLVGRF